VRVVAIIVVGMQGVRAYTKEEEDRRHLYERVVWTWRMKGVVRMKVKMRMRMRRVWI
jgi:hypothetical protein